MEKLEQISSRTCINQIKALRNLVLNEEEERCRVCNDYNNCKRYKPVYNSEIRYSHLRLGVKDG